MPTPGPRVTPTEIATWHVRHAAGATLAELAADSGRNARTIRLHLVRLGVTVEPHPNPRLGRHIDDVERRRIVAWHHYGMSIARSDGPVDTRTPPYGGSWHRRRPAVADVRCELTELLTRERAPLPA